MRFRENSRDTRPAALQNCPAQSGLPAEAGGSQGIGPGSTTTTAGQRECRIVICICGTTEVEAWRWQARRLHDHEAVLMATYTRNAPVRVALGDPLGPARQCSATRVCSVSPCSNTARPLHHGHAEGQQGRRSTTEHANPYCPTSQLTGPGISPREDVAHGASCGAREREATTRRRVAGIAGSSPQSEHLPKPSVPLVGT